MLLCDLNQRRGVKKDGLHQVKNLKLKNTFYQGLIPLFKKEYKRKPLRDNVKYPAFDEGDHVYTTLTELNGDDFESVGMFIDGISMELGSNCEGATFEVGKTYDFYIINLTPDTHPMHFHLVEFQKIAEFKINAKDYLSDWYELNGGEPGNRGFDHIPKQLDPRPYMEGNIIEPSPAEKVFRDITDAFSHRVTILRIKFSLNTG